MAEPLAADKPFVAGPPGDVTAVLHAAERAAEAWDLPDPSVVRIGINGVFRAGDVVLRVAAPTVAGSLAIDLARVLLERGIRVPAPARDTAVETDGGLWVTAWEFVEAPTGGASIDWRDVGRMVRAVHGLDPADLPAEYPLPWCAGFPWWHFDRLVETASDLIDDRALAGIVDCVSRDRWVLDVDRCDRPVVCHGDVHPGNVLVGHDGTVLIDWDLLCWGPPGWDHAPLLTWEHRWDAAPGTYAAFAAGYGADLSEDPAAAALSRLRLVAATFGRVQAAQADPSAAAELERRLQFWRGDDHAPRWTPQ